MQQTAYDVRDLSLAPSGHKIAWAWRHMPVLQSLHEFVKTKPFAGIRMAVSIHVKRRRVV